MSEDRREAILVRLEAILLETAVSGSGINVYRDRAELEDNELPAYVLLDGGEERTINTSDRRGPTLLTMSPQIFYVPVPPTTRVNEGLGPQMSEHRAKLISAVMNDGELAGLVGANGWVEYRGMESDTQTGGEVQGQFRLDFGVAYLLNFRKL